MAPGPAAGRSERRVVDPAAAPRRAEGAGGAHPGAAFRSERSEAGGNAKGGAGADGVDELMSWMT